MTEHPITRFRRAHGLSQDALARAVGVDQSTVARWERGVVLPRRRHLVRLREIGGDELTAEELVQWCPDDREEARP